MGGKGSGRRNPRVFVADEGTNPWERQSFDTHKSFALFCLYRDLGAERSISRAIEAAGKKKGYQSTAEDWSRSHFWTTRVAAWDGHLDEQRRQAEIEAERKAARDMVKRHTSIAVELQRLATVELRRHLHAAGVDVTDPDLNRAPTTKLVELRELIEQGVRLERLNRGQPERSEELITTDGGTSTHRKTWTEIVASSALELDDFDDEGEPREES